MSDRSCRRKRRWNLNGMKSLGIQNPEAHQRERGSSSDWTSAREAGGSGRHSPPASPTARPAAAPARSHPTSGPAQTARRIGSPTRQRPGQQCPPPSAWPQGERSRFGRRRCRRAPAAVVAPDSDSGSRRAFRQWYILCSDDCAASHREMEPQFEAWYSGRHLTAGPGAPQRSLIQIALSSIPNSFCCVCTAAQAAFRKRKLGSFLLACSLPRSMQRGP
jgi:hypothetical protein